MRFKLLPILMLSGLLSFALKGMQEEQVVTVYGARDANSLTNHHKIGDEPEDVPFKGEEIDEEKDQVVNAAKSLNRKSVIQYVADCLTPERAAEIGKELTGKDKVNPSKKNRNSESKKPTSVRLKVFKKLQREAEKDSRKKTISFDEIAESIGALGGGPMADKVADFCLDRLAKNGDAFREQEKLRIKAELKTTSRLACKKIDLDVTRIDSKERWKNDRIARVTSAGANSRVWIDFFKKNPYLIVGIAGGISAGYFAAKHGMKVLFDEVQKIIGIPQLAQDTSILTFRERMFKFLGFYKEEALKIDDLIFNTDFSHRIKQLVYSIKETVKVNDNFRNFLFFGLPGTGKTLAAKTIAQNSGLHYIYFAASGLGKFAKDADALNQVAELFEFAKRSPQKLIIIIDEAEILFAERDELKKGSRMNQVLNLILSYTGTESSNYFVIALTNRPQDFDLAVISRSDERIRFSLPNHGEIKKMLSLYIKKFVLTPRVIKQTFYQKYFGKKMLAKPITVETNALNNEALDVIAQKIHGFSGRDISKLAIAIKAEAYGNNLRISKKLVDQIVNRKVAEKIEADHNYLKPVVLV